MAATLRMAATGGSSLPTNTAVLRFAGTFGVGANAVLRFAGTSGAGGTAIPATMRIGWSGGYSPQSVFVWNGVTLKWDATGAAPAIPVKILSGPGDTASVVSTVTAVTALTCAKPINTADGDLLLAFVMAQVAFTTGNTFTPPAGWQLLSSAVPIDGTQRPLALYGLPVPSAAALTAPSFSFTSPKSGRMGIAIYRCTGADLSTPLDAAGVWPAPVAGTSLTSVAMPGLSTHNNGSLVIAMCHATGTAAQSWPTWGGVPGLTQVGSDLNTTSPSGSGSNDSLWIAAETVLAAGSIAGITQTVSPGQSALTGVLVALKAAVVPTGNVISPTGIAPASAFGVPTVSKGVVIKPLRMVTDTINADLSYATSATAVSSITASKPTNTADGDLLLAFVMEQTAFSATQGFTAPSGWTRLSNAPPIDGFQRPLALYALPVPSAAALTATSFTWSVSPVVGRMGLLIVRVTGANLSTILDTAGAFTPTNQQSQVPMPGIVTAHNTTLVIALAHATGTAAQSFPVWGPAPKGLVAGPVLNTSPPSGSASNDSLWTAQGIRDLAGGVGTGTVTETVTPNQTSLTGTLVAIQGAAIPANTLAPFGLPTADGIGVPAVSFAGTAQTLTAVGIPSAEAFGNAHVYGPNETAVQKWVRQRAGGNQYVGHRNGSWATYGEETLEGYRASAAYSSSVALEISIWITTDGVWVCSHDQTTGRVFTGTNYTITSTAWTTISPNGASTAGRPVSIVGGNPIRRLEEVIGDPLLYNRIWVIDNKQSVSITALVALLQAMIPGQWIAKSSNASPWQNQAAAATQCPVWPYMYPADIPANLQANYDYLLPARRAGSQLIYGYGDFSTAPLPTQSDTTTFMNFVQAKGLMSWAHILGTTAQKNTADTYAAATGAHFDGYMVSAVSTVVPASGTISPTGIAPGGGVGVPRVLLPSPIVQRDTLVYDHTSASATAYAIPLPTKVTGQDDDGNDILSISLVDGDYGVVLLVWIAGSGSPFSGLSTPDWTVLVPPTVANQICFAVLAKRYVATGDTPDTAINVTLDASRYLLAVGAWYEVVQGYDVPGPIAINPSSVLTTAVAPSMGASGANGEIVLSLFASATKATPPGVTVDHGAAVAVTAAGVPNTVMGTIASFGTLVPGPTGDATATYSIGGQSRAGVQIGLLAIGGMLGGAPRFTPTVTLAVTGVQTLSGTAAFTPTVRLTVVGSPRGTASFTPQVALSTRGQSIVRIGLSTTVGLAVTGARLGSVAFGTTVTLAAVGVKIGSRSIALGPTVTLSARGIAKPVGRAAFGTAVGLGVAGKAIPRGRASFAITVGLATTSPASATAGRASFSISVRLSAPSNLARAAGAPALGLTGALRVQATRMVAAGAPAFTPGVTLSVVGVAAQPVATVVFTPSVTLAADGFALPAEPVGVTVKPVTVEADPQWHGQRNMHTWSTG